MYQLIRISVGLTDELALTGVLTIPDSSIGIVVFAHGSGSSKSSVRNQFISKVLNDSKIATLLFDLLTEKEQLSDSKLEDLISDIAGATLNKFNIALLAERLAIATDWVLERHKNNNLPISYFGSSTGAAAALIASRKYNINSILIRSGRTDLVSKDILERVICPCLFIVGDKEKEVIRINKQTMKKLKSSERRLAIVKGASHLVEETSSIEKVAEISNQWFRTHFVNFRHS